VLTTDEKRVVVWALETEAKAFRVALRDRPARDSNDVRLLHARLVDAALAKVKAMPVERANVA
jgi:hypothetical protein